MTSPLPFNHPSDRLIQLSLKVSEAANFIRPYIYDDDSELKEMDEDEKDELIYFLISYLGEFLALLGARRTIAWDEITHYQLSKYPDFEIAVDGAQVDILNHIQEMKREEMKESYNAGYS